MVAGFSPCKRKGASTVVHPVGLVHVPRPSARLLLEARYEIAARIECEPLGHTRLYQETIVNTGQFPDADTQDILVAQPNRDRETLETIELLCRTIWATRQGWGCQTVLFHDRQAPALHRRSWSARVCRFAGLTFQSSQCHVLDDATAHQQEHDQHRHHAHH